jgi:hypothetical protein
MAQNIGGDTKFILNPREMFFIGSVLLSLAAMYYQLKSEVEEAKSRHKRLHRPPASSSHS